MSKDIGFKINQSFGSEPPISRAFKIVAEAQPPKAKSGRRLTVCAASDLPPGQRRIVQDGSLSIGVFNVDGQLYAMKNVCPHYGAPLCQGSLHGTHKPSDVHELKPDYDGRILRCPWHGWEFDLATGKGLFDAETRVATYPVEIDASGDVVITL